MFSQNNQLKRVDDTYFQTWDCSHLDNWQYMFQSCLLLETIDLSILEQTYENFEFIICDDGSTNDTLLFLNELSALDSRIRIINQN